MGVPVVRPFARLGKSLSTLASLGRESSVGILAPLPLFAFFWEAGVDPLAEGHKSEEGLESYSLGRLAPSHVAALEEHLLICERCRAKLADIEPFNVVHYTSDGPFYFRITRLRTGTFFARHWGRNLEGGKEFRTRASAKTYLEASFFQMFPEHICTSRCGPTC